MITYTYYNIDFILPYKVLIVSNCYIQGVSKKTQPRNFLRNTLQFLSIKDFRHLGFEIELLIDHITVVVH